MNSFPDVRPRRAAAGGSIAAAYADGDPRLEQLLPGDVLRVASHPSLTAGDGTGIRLGADDFTTTTADARDTLERVLAGQGAVVTTGQQPGLFLGPLFTLYKALAAAELAERLAREWEEPVIPVFWVASDDHDWEEVATTHVLDGTGAIRTLRHPAPEGHAERPVGSAPLADEAVRELIDELAAGLAGLPFGDHCVGLAREAYVPGRSIGQAFIELLRQILGERPFALIDAASPGVKRASVPLARRALLEQPATEAALRAGADRLAGCGFPATIPVLPGASCLFEDTPQGRARLYVRGDMVAVGRQGAEKSLEATLAEQEAYPERFSPNVALRPVLESSLMPVAASVLGPGELGYWAQLPDLFRLFEVPMPLVRPRMAWTIVEPKTARVLEKLGADPEDMSDGGARFLERRIEAERPDGVAGAVAELRNALETGYDRLDASVEAELPGLRSAAGKARAEARKALKTFDRSVNSRLRESQNVQRERAQLATRHLYPEGSAQERFFTPFSYLARYGPDLVDALAARGREARWPGGPDVALVDERA